jgi:phosphoglycolate phosphatase
VTPTLRALVLDFDGVILESNDIKTAAFREVFARFPAHASHMMAWHEAHVSASRFVKFEHLVFDRLGRRQDVALVQALAVDFSRLVFDRLLACPEVPGALAFLEEFSPHLPIHLASVTPEAELMSILERRRLRGFFTTVFGCPPWTKPDAVAAVVDAHGGAQGILLIGDSPGDRAAAESSGVEFIGRNSGIPFTPAARLYRDMTEIAPIVRSRLASRSSTP